MQKTFTLTLVFLVTFLNVAVAQELIVKSLTEDPNNAFISVKNEKKDLAGRPCGLVRVLLPVEGAEFEGCVTTVNKTGEYWVYMEDGSHELTISHPKFHPLTIDFLDSGIGKIRGKRIYILTLLLPAYSEKSIQQFTIRYSPKNAIVLIDAKPYQGENGVVTASLPIGQHDYIVTAPGYDPIDGSIRLKADAPSSIIIDLKKSKSKTAVTAARHTETDDQPDRQPELQEEATITNSSESTSMTALQMMELGTDYYEGRNGKKKDYVEAMKWYRKAAEQGDTGGQNNLGYMYEHGYGVSQDYNEAVKWYRKAAEQGDTDGQNNLGSMYDYGNGVSQDYNEAVKWYRRAAEQGHADGQNNLGIMYLRGYGVARDYNEAIKWFLKAADQGHYGGQVNLVFMYDKGYGNIKDYLEIRK